MPPDLQLRMSDAIREAIIAQVIRPRAVTGVMPPERLAIHARNFRAGLTAALGDTYRAVKRLTGDGFFGYAAAQFLSVSPPAGPIVTAYGGAFPRFLSDFEPAAALPFLADVARLEWALHALADTPTPTPIDTEPVGTAADLRATWSPSAVLFESPWAVDLLIEADDVAAIDLTRSSRLLLAVTGETVIWRRQTSADFAFLSALQSGALLTGAIAAACAHEPGFDAASALRNACAAGCFAALTPIQDAIP